MIRIFHYLSYLGRWGSVPVVRDETVTVAFVPLMVHVLSHAYFCLSPSVIRRSYGSLDLKNLRELNTCKQKHSWVLGCWRLKLQESGWKIETADSSNMRKNTAFLSRVFRGLELIPAKDGISRKWRFGEDSAGDFGNIWEYFSWDLFMMQVLYTFLVMLQVHPHS